MSEEFQMTSPGGVVLGEMMPLSGSVFEVDAPSIAERTVTVEQAILLVDRFYVHRDFKEARFARDAGQELRLLRERVEEMPFLAFHRTMVRVFAELRDRHASFSSHSPLGTVAVLPFRIQEAFVDGRAVYLVTSVEPPFAIDGFEVGVEVTHWNGTLIARAIEINAERYSGGNDAAFFAQGLRFLTRRPLSRYLPPDETTVTLTYLVQGQPREARFEWRGLNMDDGLRELRLGTGVARIAQGVDIDGLLARISERIQFAPSTFDDQANFEPAFERFLTLTLDEFDSALEDHPEIPPAGSLANFSYGPVTTAAGEFGYVKIFDFSANDVDDLLRPFLLILGVLPQNGLILDIRGNPGGYIAAGERLLQTLTPRRITPSRFHFRVSVETLALVRQNPLFEQWESSAREGLGTAAPYTRGFPIEDADADFNQVGQRYYGPVVLLTDALSYSTSDMFAAGFRDNEVGLILGTDDNMGAGGANNWPWFVLRLFLPGFRVSERFVTELNAGQLSADLREEFRLRNVVLGQAATVSRLPNEFDGERWEITDGERRFLLRHLTWIGPEVCVYYPGDDSLIRDLPPGFDLGFSVRRATRVGERAGMPLEDLGVLPDKRHRLTPRDILEANQDLFDAAGECLSSQRIVFLAVSSDGLSSGKVELLITTRGLDRVDVFIDGRPLASQDVADGEHSVTVACSVGCQGFEVLGFYRRELVSSARRPF